MEPTRITVRGVNQDAVQRIRHLRRVTRLPLGALMEHAVDELWATYQRDVRTAVQKFATEVAG
jgi:hypothetical protein